MNSIDFGDISNILAINSERSFSRAAEKCFVSQPALSKSARRVEKKLGIAIFDRKSVPLKLTKEGAAVMEYFERIQTTQNELFAYCETLHRQKKNVFRIGASSFICSYLLAPIISDFQAEYPNISIRFIETNDYDLMECLQAGALDCGITVKDLPMFADTSFVLQHEHILLAVPKSFPINKNLQQFALSFSSLCSGEFLSPTFPCVPMSKFRSEPFLLLKPGNDMRERSDCICRDAGFEPKIIMELDLVKTAYHLTEAGCGITFIRSSLPSAADDLSNLVFYKIDHPATRRPIKVFWSPPKGNRFALEKFISFLKDSFLP